MKRSNVAGVVLAVVTGLVAIGCGSGSPESDSGDTKADKAADGGNEAGSRDNPFAPGDTLKFDKWRITLAESNTNANDAVLAENEFNEIADDKTAVMVNVEMTYTGTDSAVPWVELDMSYVATDGTTHNEYCGVVPDDLTEVGDMYTDATESGNVCVLVDADAVDGGVWRVGAGLVDGSEGFVTTK